MRPSSSGGDLGVVAEQRPGVAAQRLDLLEHLRPQPAHGHQVDGARSRPARACGRRLRRGARRGGGRRLGGRLRRRRGGGRRPAAGAAGAGCGGGSAAAAARRGRRRRRLDGRLDRRTAGRCLVCRSGAVAGAPAMSARRSSRSSRAATPRSVSSAAGSSTRAQISSSCSRGAVAPRISVRPALTMSAARESWAAPKWAACWRIRSSSSAGCSPRIAPAASGTASMMIRSRSRSSRSSANRRGSCPASTTWSTMPEHRGGVARGERLDRVVEQVRVGEPEQPGGVRRR